MRYVLLSLLAGAELCAAQDAVRLPEVIVTDKQFHEEAVVGPYGQPAWTTARRFSTTRVYLQQPPGGVGVEQWWRGRFQRDGSYEQLLQTEVEIGLPHRWQLDLYENWTANKGDRVRHHDVAVEARWAVADWGQLPLNPTLYAEWKFVDERRGPDVCELKLLLGEELAPRWHWGANFVWEQETGGGHATEWAASQGLSYTVVDEKLSVGVEMKLTHETVRGERNDPEIKFVVGPSIQWRPTRNTHLDLVPLFGVTDDSPKLEAYVVFGFDFGPGNERGPRAPTSTRSQ